MLRVTNLKEQYIPLIANDKVIKICFDFEPFYDYDEDGNKIETNVGTWTKHTFMTKRSHSQIKDFILSEMNKRIDEKIVSGFTWNEMPVWLSTENQFNYKAAYDLAIQTGGANLPLVFKFGSTEEPVYHEFTTVEELADFYAKAMQYINTCLAEGWARKDAINWDDYKL